ncbi:hypothetical protein COFA105466_11685 [Corynebacterium falsenii]
MAHTGTTVMLITVHPVMRPAQQRQIIDARASPLGPGCDVVNIAVHRSPVTPRIRTTQLLSHEHELLLHRGVPFHPRGSQGASGIRIKHHPEIMLSQAQSKNIDRVQPCVGVGGEPHARCVDRLGSGRCCRGCTNGTARAVADSAGSDGTGTDVIIGGVGGQCGEILSRQCHHQRGQPPCAWCGGGVSILGSGFQHRHKHIRPALSHGPTVLVYVHPTTAVKGR